MPDRSTRSFPRGFTATVTALAVGAGTLAVSPVAAAATEFTLSSPELDVVVGGAFPYVRSYTDRAGGASLDGRAGALDEITINGQPHKVSGEGEVTADGVARYRLAVADRPGVRIDASLSVSGRATTFRVDDIVDTAEFRVGTIDIPGHDLVSVSSSQPGAATAFTTLDPDKTTTADVIGPLTADTAADEAPVGASYGIVNTDGLAAAVETNSFYDKPSGPTDGDDARLWHEARKSGDGATRVGMWSGQWTYRAAGATATEELPWAKVVVTPDANGDSTVDWQDGAVAFRDIAIDATGADQVADRVVTHIPFNFASQATHPFLRTLDDVKRIALSTDGLGQRAILKGYGNEGHDSAHPDYGGNYNTRAGGLDELNTLLAEGRDWNADFGVHVNATESYPEAKAFDEELVDLDTPGWNWLDQSWEIDQRRDNISGDLARRFRQLREETHENLDFLYIDVYRNHGFVADHMLAELREQGWQVGSEWSDKLERSNLWSHWANDVNYGGETNKGLNSQIIRFIRNDQRDTWNPHPILGSSAIEEFEGWTGEVDWNTFYDNIWTTNLPAKFLQQHKIQRWGEHEITFTDGVRGTDAAGKREFFVGDAKVLDGDRYLLPWGVDGGARKLYHYNPAGGTSEWTVPAEFAGAGDLRLFRLSTDGKQAVDTLPVRDGKVSIAADPGVAYVLYADGAEAAEAPVDPEPDWGHGTSIVDPGFNAPELNAWNPSGNVGIDVSERGQRSASFGEGTAAIEQRVGALDAGTYSASAWVEVEPGKSRSTRISVAEEDKPPAVNQVDASTARNWMAADEKNGTYFQRVRVLFDVTEDGARPTLRISAGDGDARVLVDDVRLVRTERPAGDALVTEDFENVDQGWGPFVKGDAGGITDPRTHLAEANGEYTKRGWHGKLVDDTLAGSWSLKSHEENNGLVYRTVPQTVRFEPGHRYRVEFDYQNGNSGQYAWITGSDPDGQVPATEELRATPLAAQHETAGFSEEFTAGPDGAAWVGLRKLDAGETPEQSDLIMDDFTVIDLGRTSR